MTSKRSKFIFYEKKIANRLIHYAEKFIGIGYSWGGNTPNTGFDCSGLVLEAIRSIVNIPDMTAKNLYYYLKEQGHASKLTRGSILFFGSGNITHVAICYDEDLKTMIEAGGGGRGTTLEESEKNNNNNSGVRIRPIRKDLMGVIKLDPIKLGVLNEEDSI